MLCIQKLEVLDYKLMANGDETSSLVSKAEAMFISIVHGSQEKRTSLESSWDNDGKFEWKNPKIEIWDGESGETVEFFVNIERNGTRWRDSMCTVTMDQFRKKPERRFTLLNSLFPVGSNAEQTSRGDMSIVLCFTEDCLQPTLLQSLFCTAFVGFGGELDMLSMDVGGFFLPQLLSARTRAQQRLLEREWAEDIAEEERAASGLPIENGSAEEEQSEQPPDVSTQASEEAHIIESPA
mmetsp:Transcript_6650/g.8616  ORF Transcript_6650/g.8616 Transcript_6650/m.8616 type:complete len:238 (+) Transcript_6650:174-887(+)